jgi:hypothetical protein
VVASHLYGPQPGCLGSACHILAEQAELSQNVRTADGENVVEHLGRS